MASEEVMVRRAQAGDLGAFEELVRVYYPRIEGYASRRVDRFDAEEITQETFLKAFGGLRGLRAPSRFRPWLYAICRNEIVNRVRATPEEWDDSGVEDLPDPGDIGYEELHLAVAALGERHRVVIRMRYFEGLRLAKIASILGVRVPLVKSRLHEAREVLRRRLPTWTEGGPPLAGFRRHLKEAVMRSVALTKNAATLFARLSLEDQIRIGDSVREGRRLSAEVVEPIARLPGGMEFLQGSDATLDEGELAALLNCSDPGVQSRFLEAIHLTHPELALRLRRAMALPELSPEQESDLRLASEPIPGRDDARLVSLEGYIDLYNTGHFAQRLGALVAAGYTRLVLACSGLNYVSSSGVGAFIALRNELARGNGDVCILSMQPSLREVFRMLCIESFFTFCDDRAQALAWARRPVSPQPDRASEPSERGETWRLLLGLGVDGNGAPIRTRRMEDRAITAAAYAGMGAAPMGATGEYLGLHRPDDRTVAAIVSDASGKGRTAADAASTVAGLFHGLAAVWDQARASSSLERLAYSINDALYAGGAPAAFCAYQVVVLDGDSGVCAVVHAGDHRLRVYEPERRELGVQPLPASPCAGSFSNPLVRAATGFRVEQISLRPGQFLILCTDGLEESRRALRDRNLDPIPAARGGESWDVFGFARMAAVTGAVVGRRRYELVREGCGGERRVDVFDFSGLGGSVAEVILALAAVEEIYRLTPSPEDVATGQGRASEVAVLAPEVDRFLSSCLVEYPSMFSRRVRTLADAVHYDGLHQEPRAEAVVLLGLGRKPAG